MTPVVLISASGLITLALYNHLGSILGRIRAFHQQKIGLLENVRHQGTMEQNLLLEMLDSHIAAVTAKARMIQRGLYCLLGAIAAFLVCALFSGATAWNPSFGVAALLTGFSGIVLFLVGLAWAMGELARSLTPLEEETAYLKFVAAHCQSQLPTEKRLKFAESA